VSQPSELRIVLQFAPTFKGATVLGTNFDLHQLIDSLTEGYALAYPLNVDFIFGFVPPFWTHCSSASLSASAAERLPSATPMTEP
jgi:hypothetical protein